MTRKEGTMLFLGGCVGSDDTRGESIQLGGQQTLSPQEGIQALERSAEHSEIKKDKVDKFERDGTETGVEMRPFS